MTVSVASIIDFINWQHVSILWAFPGYPPTL